MKGPRPPRPDELEQGRQLPAEGGAIFKGSKGKIVCGVYGNSPRIIPESRMRAAKRPPKTLPRVKGGHEQDWVRAIKNGGKAGADFSYSGPLTETCLLGNVAKRMDSQILWNQKEMRVTNLAEANKYIKEASREGWSLE